MLVTLGKAGRQSVNLDLVKLVDTRMLIQANSGGGKSWLIRLLAEAAAGRVQTIILDPEGEFATLREKVDMLLVGDEGELRTDLRSAKLLARKLIELRVSAVIDLYELKLGDRRRYVRQFLESLMSVPRKHWHQLIVMVDEAHVFCPERSAGDAESTQAVISLMSQGRKRGFCGVLATQRISKLHKDAAAECNNVCIGRTNLDVDLKRAGDVLGMSKADASALRQASPGTWYSFGPAFDFAGVEAFKAAAVSTKHPEAGKRHEFTAPAPSKAISKVLPELEDLPAEADREVKDLATAKAKIAELEREIRGNASPIDPEAIAAAEKRGHDRAMAVIQGKAREYERDWNNCVTAYREAMDPILNAVEAAQVKVSSLDLPVLELGIDWQVPASAVCAIENSFPKRIAPASKTQSQPNSAMSELSKAERKILAAVGSFPDGRTKVQIALLCGYSHKGGGFNNALSALRTKGLIDGYDAISATAEANARYGPFCPMPRGRELLAQWLGHSALGKAERAILQAVYDAAPRMLTKEDVAGLSGYEANGGGFNNALSRLRTLELITRGKEFTVNQNLLE